jgi:selenophosphate synthetase-related protein
MLELQRKVTVDYFYHLKPDPEQVTANRWLTVAESSQPVSTNASTPSNHIARLFSATQPSQATIGQSIGDKLLRLKKKLSVASESQSLYEKPTIVTPDHFNNHGRCIQVTFKKRWRQQDRGA